MLVHRVWRAQGLRFDDLEEPRDALRPPPSVEVVGVHLDVPAVVVFAITRSEPTLPVAERDVESPPRNLGISGAHRGGNEVRTALGLLATLERAHEAAAPVSGPVPSSSHEVLVFLRSIEERCDVRAEFHVIFDRVLPETGGRVAEWFGGHRRFRVHYPRSGETWTGAIDRWLREGPLDPAAADRIRVAGPFRESIARVFAARDPGAES
jgi:hypothetical protein